jgi:hypothetical protein
MAAKEIILQPFLFLGNEIPTPGQTVSLPAW